MSDQLKIYDGGDSKVLSIEKLMELFRDKGVTKIYYKSLASNDNSKNQIYIAGHLSEIAFVPTGVVSESSSVSNKSGDPKRKIKYTVDLDFSWLSPSGSIFPAPDGKLICYPQYPEVRLSGFVNRCGFDMNGWMDPLKNGRTPGRVLFLGVTNYKKKLAYLAIPDSRVAKELVDYPSIIVTGVLKELRPKVEKKVPSSKGSLLMQLKRIHLKNWIASKKLERDGTARKYTARNGGGYTLEAELGIVPNGYSAPDYLGWEVKQFGVKRCVLINGKPLTLMTPEPDGGYYVDNGAEAFVRRYGSACQKIAGRMNFTGRHVVGEVCNKTSLKLVIHGYDIANRLITNVGGCIALVDEDGNAASIWTFAKLLEHWKQKHAKAAYIPSLSRREGDNTNSYNYCNCIRLFEGTTFPRLLHALTETYVYYDPGIKVELVGGNPRTKRRSQFRIKSGLLDCLYEKQTKVDLLEIEQK